MNKIVAVLTTPPLSGGKRPRPLQDVDEDQVDAESGEDKED